MSFVFLFFFNDTATTEIYTLSLHDALPISRGFPARFSRAGSQPLPLALRPVLRRADEHFDQIIVQSVVELTLEGPFKLWMIEVAGMKFEIISMHRDRRIFELNNDFYPIAFATRRKLQ